MPWTTPGTAVAGDVLTAAFWNLNVRDNLNAIYTAGTNVVMGTDSTATTISSTTLTDTGLSIAITPSSASSKILIWAYVPLQSFRVTDFNNAGIALVRGSTVIASTTGSQIGTTGSPVAGFTAGRAIASVVYLDSPATTSSTTYKIQARVGEALNSATVVTQYNNEPSSIVCMEILV